VQQSATQVNIGRLVDCGVLDRENHDVGKVEAVWVDDENHPKYLAVSTGWLALGKTHVVPARAAEVDEVHRKVRLAVPEDAVKHAPSFDPKFELSPEDQQKINDYYRGQAVPASILEGRVEATAEESIPLKEEEVKVGKREVSAGGVRLRKIVRTETVQQPVELRHEELIVEKTPGTCAPVDPNTIGEQEFYVPLYREEPVVQKTARVREEAKLQKTAGEERKEISEQVRKEELEVEKQRKPG